MRYLDKERALVEMAAGRKVLHLGCVGFADPALRAAAVASPEAARETARHSLHARLCEVADVWGVDACEAGVAALQGIDGLGHLLAGDVEELDRLPLDETFDLIVAGDILEHVSNPGRMLDGLKRFCRPDTRLVLTTPHAYGLPNYLRFLAGRLDEGPEHVMIFGARHLRNLLERHGYRVLEVDSCHQPHARRGGRLFGLGRAFLRHRPRLGGTLFVVAVPGWSAAAKGW